MNKAVDAPFECMQIFFCVVHFRESSFEYRAWRDCQLTFGQYCKTTNETFKYSFVCWMKRYDSSLFELIFFQLVPSF